jgi:hypothetical protein
LVQIAGNSDHNIDPGGPHLSDDFLDVVGVLEVLVDGGVDHLAEGLLRINGALHLKLPKHSLRFEQRVPKQCCEESIIFYQFRPKMFKSFFEKL